MPRRPRVLRADTPLHIVQRGINREPCFFTDEDYYGFTTAISIGWKRQLALVAAPSTPTP